MSWGDASLHHVVSMSENLPREGDIHVLYVVQRGTEQTSG